ncbi:MAG: glycoside hydrolase family 97 catalytic domain-containing protein [Parabacteroides goldsteinii]|nr:glycoside hydrolase family 97 catalytic domain-containing protein [Parabacteroides goldsteinii]
MTLQVISSFIGFIFCLQSVKADNQILLDMRVNPANRLVFSLSYGKEPVILESPLGLNVDNHVLGENAKIIDKVEGAGGYVVYTLQQTEGAIFHIDTRVFPDGIALRYRIPAEGPKCIYGEETSFTFPSQTRTWYASGPFQYGWLQQYQDRMTDHIQGELLAPPATFHLPNGLYAAITEANLFNYHGAVLFGTEPNRVQFGYVENKGHMETGIITGLPPAKYWHETVWNVPWIVSPVKGTNEVVTPWRVLMLSEDLNGLVNNKILAKVSDKPDKTLFPNGADTDWIKPGRAVFTWLTEGGIERLSVDNHKKYVDGCSELGIESVVVDDGWELWQQTEKDANGRTKWEMLKDLVDYAKERNVNIWVWRSSSPRFGNRTDIGLVDPIERADFMRKCSETGVKGLKIDFFHTENLFTVNLMENILKDAAKEKLMVIFHGVNKPTGDSYTYPNLLAKEAVRGLETVGGESSWAPGPPWPYHNTVLPFTRWLVGPADYTPLNFRAFCPPSVTFAHQLSSIYMLTSPMLIFAADMEDMLSSPGRSFIESVPVVWDETVVLPESEIGKLAALARRKGDVWYLTVLNGEDARILDIKIDFLPKGNYMMEIATDSPDNRKQIEIKKIKIKSGQRLKENLMSGGGFVARIVDKSSE